MPAMANLTAVDTYAATQTYTAATPSAGDRSPAVWRNNASSVIMGQRAVLTVSTRDNAKRTARHLSITHRYPVLYTDATSGVKTIVAMVPLTLEATLPTNVDVSEVRNAFVLAGNLLITSLLRSVAEEGYAPT